MSSVENFETNGGIAIVELPGGDAGKARLVWGDALFHAEFPEAQGATGGGLGDDEIARAKFAAALNPLALGATAAIACEGDWLFGRDVVGILRAVRTGNSTFLLSFPFASNALADAIEAQVAEALDGLPIALSICAADGDTPGEILWMNETFRQLMAGSDFDLMGTALGAHFALPGTFTTLMAATGPLVPCAPFPTALRTLEGLVTPVMVSAKRVGFRRRSAAMICLARAI
jgi:hypothetical protein